MRNARSSAWERTAPARSSGAGNGCSPCCSSALSRLGACSAPATATASGRAACSICRLTVRRSTIRNNSGPSSGPISSALSSTRRSRRLSRHSLTNTTQAALLLMGRESLCRARRSSERLERRGADELDERFLQARFVGLLTQRIGTALGHHPTARDDDDVIAQRGDFLHDVRRKQHAAPFITQSTQKITQAARGHHIQTIGGLIEQHVAWIVDQGTCERGLQ